MNIKAMAGQALQDIVQKAIDYAPQSGNLIKGKILGTIDNAIGADGMLKALLHGNLDEIDLHKRIRILENLKKLEEDLEKETGEELDFISNSGRISSVLKLILEKPEKWAEEEWNFDNLLNTGDTLTKYVSEGFLDNKFSPKDWVFDLKENSTKGIQAALESTNAGLQEFEITDLAEVVEADSLVGGAFTYVLYGVIKEFLSLEGARRRNEISNGEVLKRVVKTALSSSSKGVVIGFIFSIAILIIGEWLLIPLAIIAPFAVVKMPMNLWNSFWEGLDEEQRQELVNSANQLGGNTASFFNSLGS